MVWSFEKIFLEVHENIHRKAHISIDVALQQSGQTGHIRDHPSVFFFPQMVFDLA
jgi:hypothetical protein